MFTRNTLTIATVSVALLLVSAIAVSAQPQISIRVDTVSVSPNSPTVTIPVRMDNPTEILAGFEIWFQLNKPDMIKFESKIDTIFDTTYWNCLAGVWPACADSVLVADTTGGYDFISEFIFEVLVGSYDSTGALCSGWEFVDGRSLAGNGFDLKITALSDLPSPPITSGIGPQTGGLLFNLVATVLAIPDTLTDRVVNILISGFGAHTSFSDPNGATLSFESTDGSVTILPASCCDTPGDSDNDGSFNIADVTFGIARIFSAGPAPECQDQADANGDDSFNIADVTFGIARIFNSGPAPICGNTGE